MPFRYCHGFALCRKSSHYPSQYSRPITVLSGVPATQLRSTPISSLHYRLHLTSQTSCRRIANTQYTTEGSIKTPNLLEETQEDLMSAGKSLLTGNTAGMMSSLFGAAKGAFESNQAHEKTKKTKTSSADVVMWSGCKDSQTVGSSFLLSALSFDLSFLATFLRSASGDLNLAPPFHIHRSQVFLGKLTTERRHPRRRCSNRSNVLRLHLFTQEEPEAELPRSPPDYPRGTQGWVAFPSGTPAGEVADQ